MISALIGCFSILVNDAPMDGIKCCINPVLFDSSKQWEQVQTADFNLENCKDQTNEEERGLRIFPEA